MIFFYLHTTSVPMTIFANDNPLQKERKRMEVTGEEPEETRRKNAENIMVIPVYVSSEQKNRSAAFLSVLYVCVNFIAAV